MASRSFGWPKSVHFCTLSPADLAESRRSSTFLMPRDSATMARILRLAPMLWLHWLSPVDPTSATMARMDDATLVDIMKSDMALTALSSFMSRCVWLSINSHTIRGCREPGFSVTTSQAMSSAASECESHDVESDSHCASARMSTPS